MVVSTRLERRTKGTAGGTRREMVTSSRLPATERKDGVGYGRTDYLNAGSFLTASSTDSGGL